MEDKKEFSFEEARSIGEKIGISFSDIDIDQFRMGLSVELEHGSRNADTDITHDDLEKTGKIAWAHLLEIPDYYSRLRLMEDDALNKKES